jgi:hypothetical protein
MCCRCAVAPLSKWLHNHPNRGDPYDQEREQVCTHLVEETPSCFDVMEVSEYVPLFVPAVKRA